MLTPVAVGLIAWAFTDIGRRTHPGFFVALVAVIPLLFVGAVVEFGLVAQRLIAKPDLTPVRKSFVRSVGRTYFVWFATGEGAALYSIATGARSTFLLVAPLAVTLALAIDVATSNPLKLYDDFPYVRWARRFQRKLAEAAASKRSAGLLKDAEILERLSGVGPPATAPTDDGQSPSRSTPRE
jgi:hypothetical protein